MTAPEDVMWLLAIKGEEGSGKSLFARSLLLSLIQKEGPIIKDRNIIQIQQAKEKFPQKISMSYIVTSCNAEVALRFLGIWIPVIRELMCIYSIKKSVKVEFLLSKILINTCVADSKKSS